MTAQGQTNGGPARSPQAGPTNRRGRILEQAWIWSVVGYTLVRFVVAWGAFSEHGANIWIFGLLDVGTAWPYAKAVALVARRIADGERRRAVPSAGLAIALFMLPYAYIWIAADSMPAGLRTGLAVVIVMLAASATSGVFIRSRRLRAQAASAAAEPGLAGHHTRPAAPLRAGGTGFSQRRAGGGDSPKTQPVGSTGGSRPEGESSTARPPNPDVVIDLRSEPAVVSLEPGAQSAAGTEAAGTEAGQNQAVADGDPRSGTTIEPTKTIST